MHKALQQMNIQLERVLSDIMGSTGQVIIRAMVAGERDPVVFAPHRNPAGKSSTETIAKALTGTWKDELIFVLHQALVIYAVYTAQIAVCDIQIAAYLAAMESRGAPDAPLPELPPAKPDSKSKTAPHPATRAQFARLVGVDLVAVMGLSASSVQTIITEMGTDVERFPTVKHFCSWRGLAPHTDISGGRCCARAPTRSPIGPPKPFGKPRRQSRAPTRRLGPSIGRCGRGKGHRRRLSPPHTRLRGSSTTC